MSVFVYMCIFLTSWQGTIIFLRATRGQYVGPIHFVLFASGLTGVITHFMGLWG